MIGNVVNYLVSKGIKMTAQNEWLIECYNCCINGDPFINVNKINEFVYEQWLLADLRDIGERCLPANVCQNEKTTLYGHFALQVDSFINVGDSCYSQLQKIRNISTKNLDIDDAPTQTWQPKLTRMLKLTMTDGVEIVFGMEYKSIPLLKDPFIPGIKVIITGPIECRRGVLLLESQNIQILGGETDNLLVCNAVENILARQLNLEENPAPYSNINVSHDENHLSDEDIPEIQTVASSPLPIQQDNTAAAVELIDSDDDLMLCDQVEQIENQYSQTNSNLGPANEQLQSEADTRGIVMPSTSVFQNRNFDRGTNSSNYESATNNLPTKRQASSPVHRITKPFKTSNTSSNNQVSDNNSNRLGSHCEFSSPSTINSYNTNAFRNDDTRVLSRDFFASGSNNYTAVNNRTMHVNKLSDITGDKFNGRTVYFQASVVRLTSNPRIRQNSWKVIAVLGDDSNVNLEVSFSDQFVEKLFGYSSARMVAEKEMLARDPSLQEKVHQMLKEGKRKLLVLKGQFTVKFSNTDELPVVLDVTD